jgi:hypothetical protein
VQDLIFQTQLGISDQSAWERVLLGGERTNRGAIPAVKAFVRIFQTKMFQIIDEVWIYFDAHPCASPLSNLQNGNSSSALSPNPDITHEHSKEPQGAGSRSATLHRAL